MVVNSRDQLKAASAEQSGKSREAVQKTTHRPWAPEDNPSSRQSALPCPSMLCYLFIISVFSITGPMVPPSQGGVLYWLE
ncbi:hypothetical protein R1flu_007868 [Riccia fluitans]|uniref:Uncharacterized protein n=1 Tax=Riccia fluitans TaxID=41844 RepID=A0ABD1Z1A7_9MARC